MRGHTLVGSGTQFGFAAAHSVHALVIVGALIPVIADGPSQAGIGAAGGRVAAIRGALVSVVAIGDSAARHTRALNAGIPQRTSIAVVTFEVGQGVVLAGAERRNALVAGALIPIVATLGLSHALSQDAFVLFGASVSVTAGGPVQQFVNATPAVVGAFVNGARIAVVAIYLLSSAYAVGRTGILEGAYVQIVAGRACEDIVLASGIWLAVVERARIFVGAVGWRSHAGAAFALVRCRAGVAVVAIALQRLHLAAHSLHTVVAAA